MQLTTTTHPLREIQVRPNPKFNCQVFLLLQPHNNERPWTQGEQFLITFQDKSSLEAEVIDGFFPTQLHKICKGHLALCTGISDYQAAYDLFRLHYLRKGWSLSQARFTLLICKRR